MSRVPVADVRSTDIQDAIARIKEATSGLKALKIAIMGCINANGPADMADADYGYVEQGEEVNLIKERTVFQRIFPKMQDRLVELIKRMAITGLIILLISPPIIKRRI